MGRDVDCLEGLRRVMLRALPIIVCPSCGLALGVEPALEPALASIFLFGLAAGFLSGDNSFFRLVGSLVIRAGSGLGGDS